MKLNESAACKAVVVTALHERAAAWWQRYGFTPLEKDGLDLYLLTKDVKRTLGW